MAMLLQNPTNALCLAAGGTFIYTSFKLASSSIEHYDLRSRLIIKTKELEMMSHVRTNEAQQMSNVRVVEEQRMSNIRNKSKPWLFRLLY